MTATPSVQRCACASVTTWVVAGCMMRTSTRVPCARLIGPFLLAQEVDRERGGFVNGVLRQNCRRTPPMPSQRTLGTNTDRKAHAPTVPRDSWTSRRVGRSTEHVRLRVARSDDESADFRERDKTAFARRLNWSCRRRAFRQGEMRSRPVTIADVVVTSARPVRSGTSMPTLRNSPWIRGAPQRGLAAAIWPRVGESRRQYAGDPRQSAPNAASSGGGAIRDAIAARYPAGPARVPSANVARSSPTRSKNSRSPQPRRGRASQRIELLSEREVFDTNS